MMKLQRLVFGWTANPRWMDEYERTLFNCRLGTQNAQGLKQYFFPLAAGYWRAYNSAEESFFCCTGTGAEEFAKFSDTIYFRRGSDLHVNQFIASTLDWKEEGLVIKQVTQFPSEQGTTLKVESSRPSARTIHVRIPNWTTEDAQVKLNGRPLGAMGDPGSYLAIRRVWQKGDTVSVSLPMELRREPLLGDTSVSAVMYGPLALASNLGAGPPPDGPTRILQGDPYFKKTPAPDPLPKTTANSDVKTGQWVQIDSPSELRFSAVGGSAKYELMPMYQVRDQRYSVYWQLQSPDKQS